MNEQKQGNGGNGSDKLIGLVGPDGSAVRSADDIIPVEQALALVSKYSNKIGVIEAYWAVDWWNCGDDLEGLKAAFRLPDQITHDSGADEVDQVVEFLKDVRLMILTPFTVYRVLDASYKHWLDAIVRTFDLMRMDTERPMGPGMYPFTGHGLAAAMYGVSGQCAGPDGMPNEQNKKAAARFIEAWYEALERMVEGAQ